MTRSAGSPARQHRALAMLVALAAAAQAHADKAGFYLAAGASAATYRLSTELDNSFKGSRVAGWRAEAGYIWDVGRQGGFHLGLAGVYDRWGEATAFDSSYGETIEERFAAQFFALTVVLEQELAAWADFTFKAGPGVGRYDAKGFYHPGWHESDSKDAVGAGYIAAFDFFATRHLVIEVAGQVNWFVGEGNFWNAAAVAALGTSLQWRF